MRERDDERARVLEGGADALVEWAPPEQARDREPADRDDQLRAQDPQLPIEPERAQLLLARGRDAIARSRRRSPRVAPGDRGAVEGGVERLLVEIEPAAQVLAGASAPGPPLLPLDHAGRLPVHVRTLVLVSLQNGQRLERIAGLGACAADTGVALQ
jgi:hypothetical protein